MHVVAENYKQTHTHIYTHTRDNYSNPRCAHARRGVISGWGEHDVRISVPFMQDTMRACAHCARTQIRKLCGIITCSEHWLIKLRLCFLPYIERGSCKVDGTAHYVEDDATQRIYVTCGVRHGIYVTCGVWHGRSRCKIMPERRYTQNNARKTDFLKKKKLIVQDYHVAHT